MRTPAGRVPTRLASLFVSYLLLIALCPPLPRAAAPKLRAAQSDAGGKAARTGASKAAPKGAREGDLLIRFRRGVARGDADTLIAAYGLKLKGRLRGASGLESYSVTGGQSLDSVVAAFQAQAAVEFVEPNYAITADQGAPSDPLFPGQWAVGGSQGAGERSGAGINAPAAWGQTTGSQRTVVAVVDSGVDFTHPDLRGNRWSNAKERAAADGRDDERNGYADDLHGWDWITNTPGGADEHGHGTALAGIIAAEGDNGEGVAGVMWRAGLVSLRVLDREGKGKVSDAVEAIDYAVAAGAHVVNCSWGVEAPSEALLRAVERAAASNVTVVFSAGNGGRDLDREQLSVASKTPAVLTVAAVGEAGQLSARSNWGASRVALAAPGENVLTTKAGGGYEPISGTSAAAAVVSGVVGLVRTLRPRLDAARISELLIRGARRASALRGKVAAEGVVDVAGTLEAFNILQPGEGMEEEGGDGGKEKSEGGGAESSAPGAASSAAPASPAAARVPPGVQLPGANLPDLESVRGAKSDKPRVIRPLPSTRRRCPPENPHCNQDIDGSARPAPTPRGVAQASTVQGKFLARSSGHLLLSVVGTALSGGRVSVSVPAVDFYRDAYALSDSADGVGLGGAATGAKGSAYAAAAAMFQPSAPGPGQIIISELRFRGAAGADDEFIELYNNTDADIVVAPADGSAGWALVGNDGQIRFTVPNGVTIPARGHYLAANSAAYSLSAYAAPDILFTRPLADGAGVALFSTTNPANFILANRLDAVGFAGVTDALYREGAGLQPAAGLTTTNGEYSFSRRIIENGSNAPPQDTDDNAANFRFTSTTGGNFGAQSVLGGPAPEGLTSPINRNTTMIAALLDGAVSSSASPNRVRRLCSDPQVEECNPSRSASGTFSIRRTFTNNTGRTITSLRFRVIDMTTLNSPGYAPGGTQSDMRAISSQDFQATLSNGSTVTVKGTTLEQPPTQAIGGGVNSGMRVSLPVGGLPHGQSVSMQFLLGVMQGGSFRFMINTEATLDLPTAPAAPSNLLAAAPSTSQINLSWNDNSTNETEFRVERSTGSGGPFVHVATVGANVRNWSDTGLASKTAYGYRVQAVNAGGKSAYSITANAVTPNAPPAVSVTAPANGAVFNAPATIQIEAAASDTDGTISKVEFFSGATKLGEDATAPYSFTWGGVPGGSYSLTARATDSDTATTTSAAVNVTVVPPTVTVAATDASASETGPDAGAFTVSRTGNLAAALTVNFTAGGTATSASDYNSVGTSVTIPAGAASAAVTVTPINDTAVEPTETVVLTIAANAAYQTGTPSSATVNIIDNDSFAPTVSITSPAAGATFTAPANVTINANAADSDGTISKVEFFAGATLLGQDTVAPYSFTWNGAPVGSHSLTAKATDNAGVAATSAAVNISVSLPTVTVAATDASASETGPDAGTFTVSRTGTTGSALTVSFTAGGTAASAADYNSVGTSVTIPAGAASAVVTITPINDTAVEGTETVVLTIAANAAYQTGTPSSATVNIADNDTHPPTASITAPAAGSVFTAPANVTITATAADQDGTISKVEFFRNGVKLGEDTVAPYQQAWSNVPAGSYSLTAVATDNAGATGTSAAVSVTVNAAPSVSLTAPANGSVHTTASVVTVSANAADSDGTISKVAFFDGATLLATDTAAPYTFGWSNPAAGGHTLTAVATDNRGAATTSSAVSVTVTQRPVANAGGPYSARSGDAIQFNGNGSSDPDGSVASYQWNFGDGSTGAGATPTHAYASGGTYTVTLVVTDNLGVQSNPVTATATITNPPPFGTGTGLVGNYYDNIDFTGHRLTRVDPTVNFAWDLGAPAANVGPEEFSVRWTGVVEPRYSETYTFYTTTDDGVRLFIDGMPVIDRWLDQAPTEWSGQIFLEAGRKYAVRMEFYERFHGATAQLRWSSPSEPKQIIPQTQLYGCFKPVEQFVRDFYQAGLNRQPGAGELQTWVVRISSAVDGAQLVGEAQALGTAVFESPEYAARNRTDRDFVADLYRGYLQRAPDQSGWDFWTGKVPADGRSNVREAFAQSLEFQEKARRLCGVTAADPSNGGDGYNFSAARVAPENRTGGVGVDPYSGNFNWSLPILSLAGRANLNLGLGLSYNSLVWTKDNGGIAFDTDRGFPSPGFRLGFPVVHSKFYNPEIQQAGQPTRYSYLLVTPGGGRIELRQVGTSNVYEAADTSHLQLTESGDTLTVATGDGARMNFTRRNGEFHCNQIKDRHGNFISVAYNQHGLIAHVTDTLGRVITFNYDQFQNLLSITQPWKREGENGAVVDEVHEWATFRYANLTLQPNFSGLTVVGAQPGMIIPVVERVGLGDGSHYKFEYTPWGQVAKITRFAADSQTPAGEPDDRHPLNSTRFDLPGAPASVGGAGAVAAAPQSDCPRFTGVRTWVENGVRNASAELLTSYSQWTPNPASCDALAPDGRTLTRTLYATDGWRKGRPLQAETWHDGVRRKWTTLLWTQDDENLPYQLNPRVKEITVSDGNSSRRTEYRHTAFGLVSEVLEYAPDGQTVLRTSKHEYNMSAEYIGRRMIGLPLFQYTYEGASDNPANLRSKMGFVYDDDSDTNLLQPLAAPATQHEDAGTGHRWRGNLNRVRRYDVTGGATTYVENSIGYNVAGAAVFNRDPSGHQTNVNYADSFYAGVNRAASGRPTFAYPTTFTDADGFTSSTTYNYDLGVITRSETPLPNFTDDRAGPVFARVYDAAGRIAQVTNSVTAARTRWVYPAGMGHISVFTLVEPGVEAFSGEILDGLGRVRAKSSYLPAPDDNKTAPYTGNYSGQYFDLDEMDRVVSQSNPTETNGAAGWPAAGADAATGWKYTTQTYDWNGRQRVTTNTDGTTREVTYSGCGCAGGEVATVVGELVEAIPPQGGLITQDRRTQRIYSDTLGRTVKTEVLNWDDSVYATTVTDFNARDQATLIKEYKGAATADGSCPSGTCQFTTMGYDGHGRLATRRRPEQSAPSTYIYNEDDTIFQEIDSRTATSHYTYNNRHQITGITFSAPSSINTSVPVSITYDAAGNRKSQTDKAGSLDYDYDNLSRLTTETRRFSGLGMAAFPLSYSYNLADRLTSLTDPTGARVDYQHNRAGGVLGVTGTPYGGVTQYASGMSYRAWGAVRETSFGNGLKSELNYDVRQRVQGYRVGAAGSQAGNGDAAFSEYLYEGDGRIKHATDHTDGNFNRSYSYDHLGRLIKANTSSAAYNQDFGYDEFNNMTSRSNGSWRYFDFTQSQYLNNRNIRTLTSPMVFPSCCPPQPSFWTYDASGNVTKDHNKEYTYDAAGDKVRVHETTEVGTGLTKQLWIYQDYDADARVALRVEQTTTNNSPFAFNWTYYVRSSVMGGDVITELGQHGQKLRTYVIANGKILAKQEGNVVLWLHTDPVTQSLRATNSAGFSVSREEFDPMGNVAPLTDPQPPEEPAPDYEFGGTYGNGGNPYDSSSGCTLDGQPMPCSLVMGLVNIGAAAQCPNNNCGPRFNPNRDGPGRGGWESPVLVHEGFIFSPLGPSSRPSGPPPRLGRKGDPPRPGPPPPDEGPPETTEVIPVGGFGLAGFFLFAFDRQQDDARAEKDYRACVRSVESQYKNEPEASAEEIAAYELDKKHLIELFALKVKQNSDKTYYQVATTFIGAVAGWAIAGATRGAAAGPKGALIGAGLGFLVGTGIKIGDYIFGDHQIQEELQLRSRQLAEKYPKAATRDVFLAAKQADLDACEQKHLKSNSGSP